MIYAIFVLAIALFWRIGSSFCRRSVLEGMIYFVDARCGEVFQTIGRTLEFCRVDENLSRTLPEASGPQTDSVSRREQNRSESAVFEIPPHTGRPQSSVISSTQNGAPRDVEKHPNKCYSNSMIIF